MGSLELTDLCFVDGGPPSFLGMALDLDWLNGSIKIDLREHQFITWHFISVVPEEEFPLEVKSGI